MHSTRPPEKQTGQQTAEQTGGRSARLLIIRFSSFGDIVQAVGIPAAFRSQFPNAKIDWLVRSDFSGLLEAHPLIDQVISFSRAQGWLGLVKLAWRLAASDRYSHVYDAHNNLRSRIFSFIFRMRAPIVSFALRPKNRLRRWLFFRFRLPVLRMPFRGANSFHEPLAKWHLASEVPPGPQFFTNAEVSQEIRHELAQLSRPVIALAPSAAWEMKRWPISHWCELIREMPKASFVLLGGPDDHFIADIARTAPERTLNLAGRLKLQENAAIFRECDLVIANDTGLLHVADQMERPTLALIGPTAFGYPSHRLSETVEIDLPCKPCSKDGRGRCINSLYQRCLVEVLPSRVAERARTLLSSPLT